MSENAGPPRRAGFLSTVRAVLWSFAGVRKRKDYQQDATSLNPVYVVIAGVLAAIVFVLTIVLVVRFVVSQ
ncbi:MAG: DUF2970 domain-containing protein [Candidatus Methylophosphatis roskildensis]|uniref:DUF2970 domain-containing protein n=1 Tax=Candidatus Methylophosphatis roskildensis TaxID=2899263 RepID=A0A9D7HJM6_9PROT|nr:DUF2970 domain-containing protein [Candidatus Methylophosphatis roskildensis]MBK7238507.1 DUF2970 domain-containing protein [Sterolibacteriaceae bacterium]